MNAVETIARAVLYEGYMLWPYRRSALKNQQRWTFGGVFPESWAAGSGTNDPSFRCASVLVEAEDDAQLEVQVRFLHVVERQIVRMNADGPQDVDELTVAGERYLSWQEATERAAVLDGGPLGELTHPRSLELNIPQASDAEPLLGTGGDVEGAIQRTWQHISGMLQVSAERVREHTFLVSVRVANETSSIGGSRAEALHHTMVSLHMVLRATGGAFVSVQDPPVRFWALNERCVSDGLWPVLVGDAPCRDTMLAAPIILSDYPAIAPESPGDLFDGGEIDQLLIFNVLSLTEEEQCEMRDSDPRAREILERCRALSPAQLMRLHGIVRGADEPRVRLEPERSDYGPSSF